MPNFSGRRTHPATKRTYTYTGSFSDTPGVSAWTANITTDGNSVQAVGGELKIVDGQDALRTMIEHIDGVIDLRYPAPRR